MTFEDTPASDLRADHSAVPYAMTDGQRLTGLFTAGGQMLKDCCPLFQEMTPAEYQQVLLLLSKQDYPTNDVILREGKSVQILWIIASGKCEVVKQISSTEEQKLAVLEPGAVFGEMSFLRPSPHSASIRTLGEVSVYQLTRAQHDLLVATGSSAAYRLVVNLNRILAERLASMDEWVCKIIEDRKEAPHREEWEQFRHRLYSDWQF